MRPQILVLQTSNLVQDSRLQRQLDLLTRFGDLTTVGFGAAPEKSVHHVELPDGCSSLPSSASGVARLLLQRHRSAEGMSPLACEVRARVPHQHWDLVVANNARTFDAAFEAAAGAPVWTDLHEWHPDEQGQIRRWKLLVGPYFTHLCRSYLPQAALITTVAPAMTDLFEATFATPSLVLPNAPRYVEVADLKRDDDCIRLVFVGAAEESRGIDTLVDAIALLPEAYELDLYLVPGSSDSYFAGLRAKVAALERVRICDPVAPAAITETLSAYDLGVYSMPIINRNVEVTIPNKFFDFIHAHLGVVIGPIPQMADLIREHGVGAVAPGFGAEDLAQTLAQVQPADVRRFREAARIAAPKLSFDAYEPAVIAALRRILGA